jgi:hypothetical protein
MKFTQLLRAIGVLAVFFIGMVACNFWLDWLQSFGKPSSWWSMPAGITGALACVMATLYSAFKIVEVKGL